MAIIEVMDDFPGTALAPTWEDIPDAVWSGTRTYTVGGGALTVTIEAGGGDEVFRISRGTLQRNDVAVNRLPLAATLDLKVVLNDPTTTDEGVHVTFGFAPQYEGPDDEPVANGTGFRYDPGYYTNLALQFSMSIVRRYGESQWRYSIRDGWSTTAPGVVDPESYNYHGVPYSGWDRPYYRLEKTGTTTRVSNSEDGVDYTELYSHTAPNDFAGSYYVSATNQLFIGQAPEVDAGVVPTPIKAQIQVLSDHYWNSYNANAEAYTATAVFDDFYAMVEPYPEYSETPNLSGGPEGGRADFTPAG